MSHVTVPYEPGTPCWIDLAVPDQQAALDFYGTLFGWSGEIGPPENGGYSVCMHQGHPVAGIMSSQQMDQPVPPSWTTYLCTADADATEEAVKSHGGHVIIPSTDVMDLGRMLVAADPTGAVFGVWEPRKFIGAGTVNEPGALVWNELDSTDPAAAFSFYSRVFDMTTDPMPGAEGYLAVKVKGRTIGGCKKLDENTPPGAGSHWLVYFAVVDVDRTVDKLTQLGGTVIRPPFDMVAGRMAVVTDPQRAPFAVIAPAPM